MRQNRLRAYSERTTMRKRFYIGVIVLAVVLLALAGLVVRPPAASVRTIVGLRPRF